MLYLKYFIYIYKLINTYIYLLILHFVETICDLLWTITDTSYNLEII